MRTTELTKLKAANVKTLLFLGALAIVSAGCVASQPKTSEAMVRYNVPLMSPGAQFAELPPAVQRTIRAETGGVPIRDIQKTSTNDQVVYLVLFQNAVLFPPLYIAPDGSVLNPDLTISIAAPHEVVATKTGGPIERVTLQDLPPQVVKAIQSQAPDAEIGNIVRETQGDKVAYVVTFKDRMHAVLYLAPDGTHLGESHP
jgi:hypothetical protein